MKSKRSSRALCAAFLSAVLLTASSCGYKSASRQRLDNGIRTVAVIPFENRTTTFQVEQILTRAVVNALVAKTKYQLVDDPAQADAVLTATVVSLRASPVLFGRSSLGSTFLVTMNAQVEFKSRKTGDVLFRNNRYVFREQYQINADVETFFTEQNPAIDRIAGDFAGAVVTNILEGF